jgi:hypothetical protein
MSLYTANKYIFLTFSIECSKFILILLLIVSNMLGVNNNIIDKGELK